MIQPEHASAVRNIVGLGVTLGSVVARESVKASWKLTSEVVRYAGRQSAGALAHVIEVSDIRRTELPQTVQPVITPSTAVIEFVDALATNPDNPEHIEDKFVVLTEKIKKIPEVADGIRLGPDPEGLVPPAVIAQGFLGQVVALVDRSDIPPETSNAWVDALYQQVGVEPSTPPQSVS